ncbi:MAG: hypothetical protein U1U88_000162 [Lawsonella clevelandensis]
MAIKPMLAPLLLLPLLLKRWQPFIAALLIPIILNGIGWVLSADPAAYWTRTFGYLGEVRDYYNNAIGGWLAYWGAPNLSCGLSAVSSFFLVWQQLFCFSLTATSTFAYGWPPPPELHYSLHSWEVRLANATTPSC